MKLTLVILTLLLSSYIYSQPGCVLEKTIRKQFISISDSINKNPNNYNLRWERIQLIRTATCDKWITLNPNQEKLIDYGKDPAIVSYKLDLIKELSFLIDNNVKIDDIFEQANKHNFYYLRGKEYLTQKDTVNALNDFHKALETKYKYLKIKVVKALSDYYLNKQNKSKALHYIDLVSPIEFSETLNAQAYDPFISKKKRLLKHLQYDSRLEKYLLKLMEHSYVSIPSYDKFQINSHKEVLLDNISNLAYYYYDKNQYSKAKTIIELVLLHKPDNQHYYIYNHTYRWVPMYDLLNKIYRTDKFRNKKLELDFLLKRLYADPILYNFSLGIDYLENLLKLYPNDPRVYLSWIYIKLTEEYLRWNYNVSYSKSIPDLFSKVEKLNYKGFELPYLKAVYFLNTKEYSRALNKINQALEIYNDAKLIRLKAEILKQLENPDFDKIEKMKKSVREDYFQYQNLAELVNKVNKIASH